jgi:hypothetical protein
MLITLPTSTLTDSIELTKAKLPWNNVQVRSMGNLHRYITEYLPDHKDYLPSSVTLFSDLEVAESDITSFLQELPFQLEREFRKRHERKQRFVDLNLLSDHEIHTILTGHRQAQPWALYYSKDGGLNIQANDSYGKDLSWGVVPCSSMPNHGVAWEKNSAGNYQIWLATARKHKQNWDWDSDIGHESAHSSFAPIPIFAQALHLDPEVTKLTSVKNLQNLSSGQVARMCYTYSEIAVIAMRGEQRNTETGLPVVEQPDELYAFLELSHQLMPNLGFNRALAACKNASGQIDVNDGTEIFEIGASVLRVLPHISKVISCFGIPTIDWYQSI